MASCCEHCERQVERREGPKAPRHYQFVARGIAEALQAVGAGSSYMRASRVTRDRARRFRFDAETGELRESDHGQLVADWGSCSRRSSLNPPVRQRGRQRARCCLTTCPSGFGPWMPPGDGSPPAGSPSTSSAASATAPASEALARSGVRKRPSRRLERLPRGAAGRAQADRLRRPRRHAAGDRGALAAYGAAPVRMAPAART